MAKVTKRMFEEEEVSTRSIRINKFLSDSGVCSRREADQHVEKGEVTIDGEAAVMGSKVSPYQTVMLCGKEIEREDKMVLIALNKPQGIVCTTDSKEPDNIIDFLKYGKRIYPIGRLDKDSEGLILLTNNGDIVNKILRAGNHHEKEYIVTVNRAITAEFLKGMASGVPILDTVTRPCTIEAIDKTTFRIILTQGLNRQIRRMCEYFGYNVIRLQRIRIMNIRLGHLQLGGYRNLTDHELKELKELIQESYNQPISNENDDEMQELRVSDKKLYVKTTKAGDKKKQYKGRNFANAKGNSQDNKGVRTSYKGKDDKNSYKGKETRYSKDGTQKKEAKFSKYPNDSSKESGYSKGSIKDKETRYSKDSYKDKETRYKKDNAKGNETRYSKDSNKNYRPYKDGTMDKSKDDTRNRVSKPVTTKYAAKDKSQGQRSLGQGKKEYGNAGQKTKNYRTNRTSR